MTARLDAQQREDRDADLLGIVHDPASDPAAVARAREELVRMHLPLVRHIARRFGELDMAKISPALQQAKTKSPFLSGAVQDTLDDIQMFT